MRLTPGELMLVIFGMLCLAVATGAFFRDTGYRDEATAIVWMVGMAGAEIWNYRKGRDVGEVSPPVWPVLLRLGVAGTAMVIAALIFGGTHYQTIAGVIGIIFGFVVAELYVRAQMRNRVQA